jgi:hypothetical protein
LKFYIETASGDEPSRKVAGFTTKEESFPVKANPTAPEETQRAFTVEINTLTELLRLVDKTVGAVVVEWQAKYPPAPPRQHIPVLRIVDDYL